MKKKKARQKPSRMKAGQVPRRQEKAKVSARKKTNKRTAKPAEPKRVEITDAFFGGKLRKKEVQLKEDFLNEDLLPSEQDLPELDGELDYERDPRHEEEE